MNPTLSNSITTLNIPCCLEIKTRILSILTTLITPLDGMVLPVQAVRQQYIHRLEKLSQNYQKVKLEDEENKESGSLNSVDIFRRDTLDRPTCLNSQLPLMWYLWSLP